MTEFVEIVKIAEMVEIVDVAEMVKIEEIARRYCEENKLRNSRLDGKCRKTL